MKSQELEDNAGGRSKTWSIHNISLISHKQELQLSESDLSLIFEDGVLVND